MECAAVSLFDWPPCSRFLSLSLFKSLGLTLLRSTSLCLPIPLPASLASFASHCLSVLLSAFFCLSLPLPASLCLLCLSLPLASKGHFVRELFHCAKSGAPEGRLYINLLCNCLYHYAIRLTFQACHQKVRLPCTCGARIIEPSTITFQEMSKHIIVLNTQQLLVYYYYNSGSLYKVRDSVSWVRPNKYAHTRTCTCTQASKHTHTPTQYPRTP